MKITVLLMNEKKKRLVVTCRTSAAVTGEVNEALLIKMDSENPTKDNYNGKIVELGETLYNFMTLPDYEGWKINFNSSFNADIDTKCLFETVYPVTILYVIQNYLITHGRNSLIEKKYTEMESFIHKVYETLLNERDELNKLVIEKAKTERHVPYIGSYDSLYSISSNIAYINKVKHIYKYSLIDNNFSKRQKEIYNVNVKHRYYKNGLSKLDLFYLICGSECSKDISTVSINKKRLKSFFKNNKMYHVMWEDEESSITDAFCELIDIHKSLLIHVLNTIKDTDENKSAISERINFIRNSIKELIDENPKSDTIKLVDLFSKTISSSDCWIMFFPPDSKMNIQTLLNMAKRRVYDFDEIETGTKFVEDKLCKY